MTPEEVARLFQSASATCRGDHCPYASECKGTRETCRLRDVSLLLRAMETEIEEMHVKYDALSGGANLLVKYIHELERINARYYRIISQFQKGYRPPVKVKKSTPYIRKGRKKKSLAEMDGDERYAMPEEPKEPKPPVVII